MTRLQERLDALADATYAYEGGERECAAFKLGAKNALVHLDAAEAEIARLKEERDRIERNRDMWKGQCERKAAQLQPLRTKDAG